MRVSINFSDGKASENNTRIARLYLEPDELPGVKAVKFNGTLSSGLIIEDDGNPRRLHNYEITERANHDRMIYVPQDRIGLQPDGRSRKPKSVSSMEKTRSMILLDAVSFLPLEMSLAGHARPRGGKNTSLISVREVKAFQTPDGEVFTSEQAARVHMVRLNRKQMLMPLIGRALSHIEELDADRMSLHFGDVILHIDHTNGKREFAIESVK